MTTMVFQHFLNSFVRYSFGRYYELHLTKLCSVSDCYVTHQCHSMRLPFLSNVSRNHSYKEKDLSLPNGSWRIPRSGMSDNQPRRGSRFKTKQVSWVQIKLANISTSLWKLLHTGYTTQTRPGKVSRHWPARVYVYSWIFRLQQKKKKKKKKKAAEDRSAYGPDPLTQALES